MKILQKEQNSTNLLLWPPICRNKPAITPKWFNSLDTNSTQYTFIPILSECVTKVSQQPLKSQWCRKWGGAVVIVGENLPFPGWNRVIWSAKYCSASLLNFLSSKSTNKVAPRTQNCPTHCFHMKVKVAVLNGISQNNNFFEV